MTTLRTLDNSSLTHLYRTLIGFDQLMNSRLQMNSGNYPPFNVIKYDDTRYSIEVAVAGFTKDEISVKIDQDQLIITGNRVRNQEECEYLHKALAYRDFEQSFALAEYMEVRDAEIKDGLLVINIEKIIPETLKPRLIEIN